MEKNIPKRVSSTLMSALKGGVVPRIGLEHIAVGREDEIKALQNDIDIISDGGAAFRFIIGRYGSGKSFLLQMMRNYAMNQGFVVIDADLSPERRLQGTQNQGVATYRELISNMSTKTKASGAITQIIEKWISGIQMAVVQETDYEPDSDEFAKEVKRRVYVVVNEIENMVNGFDFAKAIVLYYEAFCESDDEKKSNVLRWFRGEYTTKTEAKQVLGINMIVNDSNWYDFIKIYAEFVVQIGYKGMIMIIDELVNIYRISSKVARQNNYEKLLMIYNDVLQGRASHIGILMGGTPECMEDTRTGIFSYEALKSRLISGRFEVDGERDLLSPIIKIEPLMKNEIRELLSKLGDIHSSLYKYDCNISESDINIFLENQFSRIGAADKITPREIIREYIEILNILYQHPEKTISEIVNCDNAGNSVSSNESKTSNIFANFEV